MSVLLPVEVAQQCDLGHVVDEIAVHPPENPDERDLGVEPVRIGPDPRDIQLRVGERFDTADPTIHLVPESVDRHLGDG